MARLRHIAVCVKDLEKAAKFYETVFEMKEVGRETIEIGSAIYMSDGVINMALLNFAGNKGNDLKDPKNAVGANHFGFQVENGETTVERMKKINYAKLPKPRPDGRPYAEIRGSDPDGNYFDISEHGFLNVEPVGEKKSS